jgi:hypothetical protein
MKHKALLVVLALGAIAGFGSSLFGCHYHHAGRREAFEEHIADVCTRAAERSRQAAPRAQNTP